MSCHVIPFVSAGKDVTKDLVLSCFRDEPANCVNFDGTTGTVAFNVSSGERKMEIQTAEYSLYNLIDYNWKVRRSGTRQAMRLTTVFSLPFFPIWSDKPIFEWDIGNNTLHNWVGKKFLPETTGNAIIYVDVCDIIFGINVSCEQVTFRRLAVSRLH